jgi:hypothetical protein
VIGVQASASEKTSAKNRTDAGGRGSRPTVISPRHVGNSDRDNNEAVEGGRRSPPPLTTSRKYQ